MSNEQQSAQQAHQDKDADKLSFWQVVFSTLASFFGVQSQKNRERDFSKGNPLAFIVAGLVLTILFIVIVVSVVRAVLHMSGV